MKDSKIRVITLVVVLSLLGTPVLSLAKAGSGYRGGRGSSQSGGMSSNSVGSRGSRTSEPNGFKPIERSNASPGSAAGTPRATGPGTSPAAAAPPVAQPSFFQRHPVLSGIAAGLAGSWIGHMLFGATSAPAATQEGSGNPAKQEDGYAASSSGPSAGLLLFLLMAFAAMGLYYVYKRRNGSLSPALTGFGSANPVRSEPPAWVPPSVGVLSPLSSSEPKLTAADEEEFRRLLVEIQTAWSQQDIQRLRRVATPEMCQYFSDKLAENVSGGVENRVEDVAVIGADVRESWAEDTRLYATVLMQWKARDYVRSLTKPSSDPGYLVEGDDRVSTEVVEAWTFVKHREGQWLLSAIQQVG